MVETKQLSALCELKKGLKVSTISEASSKSIPYLLIDTLRGEAPTEFTEDERYTEAVPEDILIVGDGANSGLVGTGLKGAVGSTIIRMRLTEKKANKDYIMYYLKSKFSHLNLNIKGAAIPHLKTKEMMDLEIRFPSEKEQEFIVAEIEKQFTRLDSAVQSLQNVKKKLEVYRNATLKSAFSGSLIKTPITWKSVGDFVDMTSGYAFKKAEYTQSGVRLFQIANVTFGRTTWNDTEYLPESYIQSNSKLLLKKGDVLMALNRPLLSHKLKIAILTDADVPAILYQRVGKFDFLSEKIIKEFFFYYLRSPFFVNDLEKTLQGVNIPFINKSKLLKFKFPFCDYEIQKQIISEIESKFSVIDKLEENIDEYLLKAETLRKSILKSAFEGKLVRYNNG